MISSQRIVLFALLPLMILAGCKEPAEHTAASLPPVEVRVEPLVVSAAPTQLELSGTLQAVDRATISARVTGQIGQLPVQIGAQVRKGDLLLRISAEEINARFRQAEIRRDQDRRNLERESKLLEVNASTREMVRTLEEQAQASEAAYREAQTMLGYTEIRAPFSGTVIDRYVEAGDLVAPGGPLLKLENSAKLEVVIQVPEAESQQLTLASRLPVSVPTAGLAFDARVREISPTVDPASRTTQIKLILPEAPGLRSGQFARVTLADNQSKTIMIKRTALKQNGQMQQVFVAEQGLARMRLVRTGADLNERIEILSGLRAGDQVIVDPPTNLRDGQPLVIKDGSEQ